MPIVRYTLQVEGETNPFSEQDTFLPIPADVDIQHELFRQIITPLNLNRDKLGEPPLHLVGFILISGHVHLHSWKRTHESKFALKAYYQCQRCKITGFRHFTVMGEEKGLIERDPDFKNEKQYQYCRDPLKPLPKTICFE